MLGKRYVAQSKSGVTSQVSKRCLYLCLALLWCRSYGKRWVLSWSRSFMQVIASLVPLWSQRKCPLADPVRKALLLLVRCMGFHKQEPNCHCTWATSAQARALVSDPLAHTLHPQIRGRLRFFFLLPPWALFRKSPMLLSPLLFPDAWLLFVLIIVIRSEWLRNLWTMEWKFPQARKRATASKSFLTMFQIKEQLWQERS